MKGRFIIRGDQADKSIMEKEQVAAPAVDSQPAEEKQVRRAKAKEIDWEVRVTLTLGALVLFVVAYFYMMIFDPELIVDLYIAVACVIPIILCVLSGDKVPTYMSPIIYIGSSVAVVWFLFVAGDFLLPAWAITRGGRGSHSHVATGGYLAAWTGLTLFVFGAIGAWVIAAEAIAAYRKKRHPVPAEAPKKSRLPQ